MKIKRIATILLASAMAVCGAQAKKMSDLKIYINPGHGGYTSNDRPIKIYPFEQNDTLGYWESKSNLYKGLHMYHILKKLGATPYLSRTKNTEADDRSLSGIAAEATNLGVDIFLSIHSNAGENTNRPLMLYREQTIGTPRYPENVPLSKIMWKTLFSNQLPVWTSDKEWVCGDLTFYQNMWEGGLGVLRTLYTVGLLSEGGMHEHRPEAYRLMNDDYWWLEAWHFVHAIMEFCDTEDRFVTGNVAGIVYDNHNLREKDMPVNFSNFGRDRFAPINFATVELLDKSGKVVQSRVTDNMYNGVFVFREVDPGEYTVRVKHDNYYEEKAAVTVKANEVSYQDMPLTMRRESPLEIVSYTPKVDQSDIQGNAVSCATTLTFKFNHDVDTESLEKAFSITPDVDGYWEYSESYTTATFVPRLSLDLNTEYTVKIDASAKSPDGYYSHPQLKEDFVFKFFTKGRNRLEMIDQFPQPGGKIHYVAPSFEFRFDKSIDAAGIYDNVTVTDSQGKAVAVNKRSSKTNQLSNGYGNVVMVVSGSLKENETYHVKLSGELRDREQLPMVNDVEFDFTAVDVVAEAPEQEVKLEFEDGTMFAYDPDNTKGIGSTLPTALASTSVKLFGKSSQRFTYNFTDNHGGEVVWKYTGDKVVQFNTGDVLGMYVYGDFNNHEVWVGVASGSNIKYNKLCDLDFLGWQYREVRLDNLEADFCPFLLSEVKLIQKQSNITQKGAFAIDNLGSRTSEGVNDIVMDIADDVLVTGEIGYVTVLGAPVDAPVKVVAMDGRVVATSTGNCSLAVVPGMYVVTVGNATQKVTVK